MSCCIVAYSLHSRYGRFTATHHAATLRRRNLYKTDFLYSSLTQRGRRASAIKSAPTEAVGALVVPVKREQLLNHNPSPVGDYGEKPTGRPCGKAAVKIFICERG